MPKPVHSIGVRSVLFSVLTLLLVANYDPPLQRGLPLNLPCAGAGFPTVPFPQGAVGEVSLIGVLVREK